MDLDYHQLKQMNLEEAKRLMKEAIDEAEKADDIFRLFVEKVYKEGFNAGLHSNLKQPEDKHMYSKEQAMDIVEDLKQIRDNCLNPMFDKTDILIGIEDLIASILEDVGKFESHEK